jgi:lactate permease
VVWPALLLYRLAERAGMERIGQVLRTLLPARTDRLLALAWVVPSLIQGVAGFGTPIAVVTPLLVSLGYPMRRALLFSLVGYHWSVTFGSMGSSFYMASLTAGLTGADQELFALRAAILLGVNCLAAGALVLLLDGGRTRAARGRAHPGGRRPVDGGHARRRRHDRARARFPVGGHGRQSSPSPC